MGEVKEELLESVPYLLKMPSNRIWIDYDENADVLYISFQKPQHADDSEMQESPICNYDDTGSEWMGGTDGCGLLCQRKWCYISRARTGGRKR
jgi:uncharacterized protein YuzE